MHSVTSEFTFVTITNGAFSFQPRRWRRCYFFVTMCVCLLLAGASILCFIFFSFYFLYSSVSSRFVLCVSIAKCGELKQCCNVVPRLPCLPTSQCTQPAASTNVQLLANWFVVHIMPAQFFSDSVHFWCCGTFTHIQRADNLVERERPNACSK